MQNPAGSLSKKTGLPPGSPVYTGAEQNWPIKTTCFSYDKDSLEVTEFEAPAQCMPPEGRSRVTWINIDGLHNVSAIEELAYRFDIHPLTVEDILHTQQRPKIDIFDDYLYIVFKMHRYNEATQRIDAEQISLVLFDNLLLSFQETAGDVFEPIRNRLKGNKGKVRKLGADYLAYALLDSVVDHYFVVLERIGEEIEELEDSLIEEPSSMSVQQIHLLKREMILLRKSVWPLREVISLLHRNEIELIGESISVYMKDLYDHTIQVIDTIETYRDMLSGMLDIYLSSISNRMNEIMKVLTIFAALFIPLTLIAGIYGMNFNTSASPYNMPELNWVFGYPFALGLMVFTAVVMLLFFKRKKWL